MMICLYIFYPDTFEVAKGMNAIKMLSPLHILWILWVFDMILQLSIAPGYWPLGSQKVWGHRYLPQFKKINKKFLKEYIETMNTGIIKIAVIWIALIAFIGVLYFTNIK